MIGASRLWRHFRFAIPAATLTLGAACGDGPTAPAVEPGCTPAALDVGGSVLLSAGEHCVQLTSGGSRFMVGVLNTSNLVSSMASFELVGRSPGGASASIAPEPGAAPAIESPAATGRARASLDLRAMRGTGRERTHQRVLELSRSLSTRFAARRHTALAASPSGAALSVGAEPTAAPTTGLRAVGDMATLRIPDINAANACNKYFEVQVRVVHAGQHAIVVEDAASPVAGQMDARYRQLGDEFDRVMWPILTANFGDPLRMDSQLDANGKIVMLFSPVVNRNFEGIAGFVIGCDFYPRVGAQPRDSVPASNEGEVFYAMVPTDTASTNFAGTSLGGWLRTIRSTLIHEAKHITSFAERTAANNTPEHAWLEEGTARHAEELYARALSNATWKGNAGYTSIACEVYVRDPQCAGRPFVMFKHFDGLYEYMQANGSLSPLGKANDDDFTYYGSAWSLVRWAADLAPNEAEFFKRLTRGPQAGIANLEAASGRTWATIVSDWTMALAVDDYPGAAPDREQSMASWNLRNVFAGMNADFAESQGFYTARYPLEPERQAFGAFTISGSDVRGGAGRVIELTGTWPGQQVLELKGPGGATPPTTLRLVVTRVQ